MASPEAIAEGGSVVTADQINYQQKMFSHPSYRFEPQYPNTFGQTISLGTSQTPVVINIPPEVINLSQSYLNYEVTIPTQGAGNSIWYALNALQEISHIQLYSGNSQWIVDVDQLQNYLDIILKKEIAFDEWESNDANSYSLSGFALSNLGIATSLRNANMTTANVDAGQTFNSSVGFIEPAYFTVTAANTAAEYNIQFPLRLIKNTLFSCDKNVYFGQTTYLKVYFGPISKVGYKSNSIVSPSAGTKVVLTGNSTISNLTLMLAVESNQDIRKMVINKVENEGLSYLIPYVQAFKNSNGPGTSQNISVQLDQGFGRSLLKVYHAPYNSLESFDAMYDRCNLPTDQVPGSATAQKVQNYYTQLNGKRLQDLTLDCTWTSSNPLLDYMQHKRQLRGSVTRNQNIYQYNWFHCDDFSDFGPRYDHENKGELISGIPMSTAPLTWSFVGVQMAGIVLQHYTYFVFIRKLSMGPNGQVNVQ